MEKASSLINSYSAVYVQPVCGVPAFRLTTYCNAVIYFLSKKQVPVVIDQDVSRIEKGET
jgi:phage gp36-like protein